jgi:hypothetical protein
MMPEEVDKKSLSSTLERGLALVCLSVMSALAFVVGYFNPTTAGFFPVCPLYSMTGLACPGCGMTRGTHALLHGDVVGALDYNLLLPAILFFFGYLFVSLFLTAARGRGLSFELFKPKIVWGFFAVALVFSVVRNLPFYPFSILYP